MIISCKSCSRKFIVKDEDIPKEGRTVQCGYCSVFWHQEGILTKTKIKSQNLSENLSIDKIKASDGKTYKFLGVQWAELMPSGKTGLFAKKKISKELDIRTGRKEIKNPKKRTKRIGELNPASETMNDKAQLPDIYKPQKGIGFLGYIFLLIIISFSAIGIIKTFEDDWLNYFPQDQYIFDLLDSQLIFISETVKNIVVIIKDLLK